MYMALRMRRSAEPGTWEPDALEWVEDERLFADWVAMSKEDAHNFLTAAEED